MSTFVLPNYTNLPATVFYDIASKQSSRVDTRPFNYIRKQCSSRDETEHTDYFRHNYSVQYQTDDINNQIAAERRRSLPGMTSLSGDDWCYAPNNMYLTRYVQNKFDSDDPTKPEVKLACRTGAAWVGGYGPQLTACNPFPGETIKGLDGNSTVNYISVADTPPNQASWFYMNTYYPRESNEEYSPRMAISELASLCTKAKDSPAEYNKKPKNTKILPAETIDTYGTICDINYKQYCTKENIAKPECLDWCKTVAKTVPSVGTWCDNVLKPYCQTGTNIFKDECSSLCNRDGNHTWCNTYKENICIGNVLTDTNHPCRTSFCKIGEPNDVGLVCKKGYDDFCKGENLNTAVCADYCGVDPELRCGTDLREYCMLARNRTMPDGKSIKPLCQCYLPFDVMETWKNSMKEKLGEIAGNELTKDTKCMYSPCINSGIWRQKGQCPNVTACVNSFTVGVGGNIYGDLNYNPNNKECQTIASGVKEHCLKNCKNGTCKSDSCIGDICTGFTKCVCNLGYEGPNCDIACGTNCTIKCSVDNCPGKCENGICIEDKCLGVLCPVDNKCDPSTGKCKPTCNASMCNGTCIDNKCVPNVCVSDECNGTCIDNKCVPNVCVPDECSGTCIDNKCAPNVCVPDECSGTCIDNKCVPSVCDGIVCPDGFICNEAEETCDPVCDASTCKGTCKDGVCEEPKSYTGLIIGIIVFFVILIASFLYYMYSK